MRSDDEIDGELDDDEPWVPDEIVVVPVGDEIDLHAFAPADAKDLILEFLRLAVTRELSEVRIVHGKGTGALRALVHRLLDEHPDVESYQLASGDRGGWGATIVRLKSGA